MVQTSVLICFFIKLANAWNTSKIASAFKKAGGFLAESAKGCLLGRLFSAKNADDYNSSSVFYSALSTIWRFIYGVFAKIYETARSGVFFRVLRYLLKDSALCKTETVLACGIFLIFVCPHTKWNNMYALLLALLALVFYLTGALRKRGFRTDIRGIWLPLILFIGAAALSVTVSPFVSDSVRVFMFFLTSFLLCTELYGTLTDKKRFDFIMAGAYLSLVVTGIVALVQKKMGIAVDSSLTDVTLNADMPGRAFSTMGNPNNYAEFLVIFLPICFAFAISRKTKLQKTVFTALLLIPFLALVFTYSRSGWLGFAVTLFVFAALYNKKLIPVIIVLGILAVPFMPRTVLNRIMTIGNMNDTSSAYRIFIWQGALSMLKTFWYSGVGLGPAAFHDIYPLYSDLRAVSAPHTHMLFFEVFAEMGIIGLLTFVYFVLALLVRSCKKALGASGDMRFYSIAAASSMAGIMTIGFAEYVWFYPRVMFAFFIAIGIAMAAIRRKDDIA